MKGDIFYIDYVTEPCCRVCQLKPGDLFLSSAWLNQLCVYDVNEKTVFAKMGYINNEGFLSVYGMGLSGQKKYVELGRNSQEIVIFKGSFKIRPAYLWRNRKAAIVF